MHLLSTVLHVTAASSSSSSFSVSNVLLAIVPVAAFAAVYFGVYLYYRNTNKSYQYEQETTVTVSNMQRYDAYEGANNGTTNQSITGRNSELPRSRVARL